MQIDVYINIMNPNAMVEFLTSEDAIRYVQENPEKMAIVVKDFKIMATYCGHKYWSFK